MHVSPGTHRNKNIATKYKFFIPMNCMWHCDWHTLKQWLATSVICEVIIVQRPYVLYIRWSLRHYKHYKIYIATKTTCINARLELYSESSIFIFNLSLFSEQTTTQLRMSGLICDITRKHEDISIATAQSHIRENEFEFSRNIQRSTFKTGWFYKRKCQKLHVFVSDA